MAAINAVRERAPDVQADARVLPLWRVCQVDVLSQDELQRLKGSLDRLLGDVGVTVPDPRVRTRLRDAGALVDDAGGEVRLPAPVVAATLDGAMTPLRLAGRDPACDLLLDGSLAWLSGGAVAPTVLDLVTGEPRPRVADDLVQAARLVDAVPQLAFVGPVAATDGVRDLGALVAATGKHVQVEVPEDPAWAHAVVEIAEVLAGDREALAERPPLSAALRLDEPLVLDRLGAAAELARAGIPCAILVDLPLDGSAIAGVAAGAVCLRLLVPGASVLIGSMSPGAPRSRMAWVQLIRSLGLPSQLGAFPTASAASDWRAGVDGGLAATAGWMTPPDLLSGAGLRAGGRVFSPSAMLLDSELYDLVRFIPPGFDVDDETLAVQVIADVGPAEHFLGEQHTLRHFREVWMSRFMDTSTWETWEATGRPEAPDHAAEHARELLATHEPMPLAPGVEEAVGEVIQAHGRAD